jgi:metastasis-associated protein MTA
MHYDVYSTVQLILKQLVIGYVLCAGVVIPQPGPPAKRPNKEVGPVRSSERFLPVMGQSVISHLNGKAKIATMTRSGSGRKQAISWMATPDGVYFLFTDGNK